MQKEEVHKIKSKYAQKIRENGSDDLASMIATLQEQDLKEIDRLQMLVKTHPDGEEHADTLLQLHNELRENENKEEFFDITEYDERQPGAKQRIAMDYADFLVKKKNIRPVVIDSTTLFYRYDKERKVWEEIDFDMIKKTAYKTLSNFWTRHTRAQFQQSMEDHAYYIHWEQIGLDENELLMKNGKILNLDTKKTKTATKEDYALNGVNAVYEPDVESELLERFIERTFPFEDERKALQEFIGYTLSFPSDKYETALLLLGNTDTGKSTFLKVLEKFYELANTTNISFPQLGHERAFHINKLKESVINFDHDMSNHNIDNYSRIKKLISKEGVYADPKGVDGYDMKSQANFVIASNNAPDDDGADEAFYNRFLTVQAPKQVPEEKKDRDLVEKLTAEKELNWLLKWGIEGLERLEKQNRFTVERSEYETKKIWTKYGDSIDKFIHDQITRDLDEGKNIPTSDVYEAYKLWCETELDDPVSQRQFIARASDHPDMEKKKAMAWDGSGQRMCFKDIEVKDYDI